MSYSKWDPNKVHFINGQPFMYNKADNKITQFGAEQQFKKAVHTMHTWFSRYFKLTALQPDAELREHELERMEWDLDNLLTWAGAMRKALDEERGKQRKQETIDSLMALAERSPFPEEADTARRMAERKQSRG